MKAAFSRLGRQILIPSLIISVVLMGLLGIFMVRKNEASLYSMMESKGNGLIDFITKVSADYFVIFDFRDLENFVRVLESDPDVAFAAFYNSKRAPLSPVDKVPADTSSLMIYERDIKDEGGNILGHLRIGFNRTKISSSRRDNIIIISSSTFIALALLSIGIMLAQTIKRRDREIAERRLAQEELKRARNDWEDTFNTITDMITIHDSDYNIIHSNKAAEKILGLPFLEEAKAKCFKYYHGTETPPGGCPSCSCLKTGQPATFEIFEPHLKRFVEIRAMPRFDVNNRIIGLIHVVRDITDKRKIEDKIRRQLSYINSLHTIEKAISSSFDLNITLDILLEQVINHLQVDAASVLILNSDSHYLEYAAGRGFRTDIVKSSLLRLGKGCAGRAALERKPFIVKDFGNPPDGVTSSSLVRAEEFRTYVGAPVISKGKVKGVLEIFHRSDMDLDREWMDFLNALAGQAAIAIDNARMIVDLHRTNDELVMTYDSTIEGWSRALDYRDKETEGHSQRVTELSLAMARAMGIEDEELVHIRRGALLHDIGKLGVPDSILLKFDKLDEEEWKIMKRHPVIAYEILSPISFLRPAINIPLHHHEKWDGTGYPSGFKGQQIPLAARIFALVDIYDALKSNRPYRQAWPEEKVLDHIRSLSGSHLDPDVVEVFFRIKSGKA